MKRGWAPQRLRLHEEKIRAYCEQWAEVIFVREQIEGRWTDFSLAQLPEDLRKKWVDHFVEINFMPHRIKANDERNRA